MVLISFQGFQKGLHDLKEDFKGFRESLSKVEIKTKETIEKVKDEHPFVAKLIDAGFDFLPPPANKIASFIWNISEGSEEEKTVKLIEYLENLERQGEQGFKESIAKLDYIIFSLEKIEETSAKQETVEEIKSILESGGEEMISKLDNIEKNTSSQLSEILRRLTETQEAVKYYGKIIEGLGNTNGQQVFNNVRDNLIHGTNQTQRNEPYQLLAQHIETIPFTKITDFWKRVVKKPSLQQGQYVCIKGATLSRFIPVIVGSPREKIYFHHSVREDDLEKRKLKESQMSTNTILSFTAGQMVWRPKLNEEFVLFGLYQSIVRNSIPVYVYGDYIDHVNKLFETIHNHYTIDVTIQGTLRKIGDDFASQFTGQEKLKPEVRPIEGTPIFGIEVGKNENTWITDPTETKYLDGDIWIRLQTKTSQTTITRFLDLSDPEFLRDECRELKREWHDNHKDAELMGQFDEVESQIAKDQFDDKIRNRLFT